MSLPGPILIVGESSAADLIRAAETAGAFPIVELGWADAAAAVAEMSPTAVLISEPHPPSVTAAQALAQRIAQAQPLIPIFVRLADGEKPPLPHALPFPTDLPAPLLIARLRSALRVRALHAAVLRRAQSASAASAGLAELTIDPLGDATVLIVGRGRTYPALTVAVGEQVGIVGTFSVEAAARYLNARDIDGIVIGDGFGSLIIDGFLTVLAGDVRFRELPIAVPGARLDREDLANVVVCDELAPSIERLLPLVGFHAVELRLKRALKSLEADGLIDGQSGLLTPDAFWRNMIQAVKEAEERGTDLSLARFAFEGPLDRRAGLDAARLLSRLVRALDFACQENDGSIVAAFTETDLRAAHVIARRIASVLKHTMLAPDPDKVNIQPTITLATRKATDTVESLAARVLGKRSIAAG
ncbi:MAG: GGDEF domain-containing protein [Xanthobacteraceae bacterium]